MWRARKEAAWKSAGTQHRIAYVARWHRGTGGLQSSAAIGNQAESVLGARVLLARRSNEAAARNNKIIIGLSWRHHVGKYARVHVGVKICAPIFLLIYLNVNLSCNVMFIVCSDAYGSIVKWRAAAQ